MNLANARRETRVRRQQRERGVGMLQLVIVVGITGIVAAFAVLGMARARTATRLAGAANEFTSYLEKARADSIRRHAAAGAQASVQITSATTYRVTLDFNYDGTVENRTLTLPTGVTFIYDAASPPPTVAFNWRGRVAAGDASFTLQAAGQNNIVINMTGDGDVSGNSAFNIPAITATPIPSSDIKADAAVTPTPTPKP